MAYEVDPKARFILGNPVSTALICLGVGLLGGFLAQQYFGQNLFEQFGAVTAALALLSFGVVASELLVRGQFSFIMGEDGEPDEPFKTKNVRTVLSWQTACGFIGTLQWGFGSLVFGD